MSKSQSPPQTSPPASAGEDFDPAETGGGMAGTYAQDASGEPGGIAMIAAANSNWEDRKKRKSDELAAAPPPTP